jgi:3-methyladenine DNA glycosylase/8-oxoguanine DNA glycosylase
VPGAFDGFEVAVRAILGQQVSVAAGVGGRALCCGFGDPLDRLSLQ